MSRIFSVSALAALAVALPAFAGLKVAGGGIDVGPTAGSDVVTASIILKARNVEDLREYIDGTVTPGDWRYHRFLSVGQFADRFAPSPEAVAKVVRALQNQGLRVDEVYPDRLVIVVTGTIDQLNAFFSASVHDFVKNGQRYHKPTRSPQPPAEVADTVLTVAGLSNERAARPHSVRTRNTGRPPVLAANGTATGIPQEFTVGDVANMYQINPLYAAGFKGQGQTIGIATLANFDPADATAYWKQIGLKVKKNRIEQVHVLGGSDFNGADETTLDVQQSGGLAPQADVIVYDAPNTDGGFLSLFYKVVSENRVDTMSVSWGSCECFYFPFADFPDDFTWELHALDVAFMEGAVQGISMFAASGDSGAFDNDGFGTDIVSIDAPGNDPYITSAGGTTVPVTLDFGARGIVTVTKERTWAWDYLVPTFRLDQVFPVGAGGGVSIFWPRPSYQRETRGLQNSAPNQHLFLFDAQGNAFDEFDPPANFPGRNVPDVSLNADPETGYKVFFEGEWIDGFGGTSFVAPQLAGITALMGQAAGPRLGFLNPQLYRLQRQAGYGPNRPFNDITAGTDWFYLAAPGYEPSSGIGTLNVANLTSALLFGGF